MPHLTTTAPGRDRAVRRRGSPGHGKTSNRQANRGTSGSWANWRLGGPSMPEKEARPCPTGDGHGRTATIPAATDSERPPLAERFRQFDDANGHIYRLLVRLTRDYLRRTGRDRVGIAAVYERARWELAVSTTETAPTLNNDYRSFYARKIMAQETDLAGVFETRRSTADKEFGVVRWPGADGPRLDRGPVADR